MSDLISRSALIEDIKKQYDMMNLYFPQSFISFLQAQPLVEPVRGEWVYWKEQCKYCVNRSSCPYPENQESMESLIQWEKQNKFWGSLKLICDYHVLDKDKYYLDNSPGCNVED